MIQIDEQNDMERIENEVNRSTPDQLKSLLTSALIALHDQRRDISKLNMKMDALLKLLIEKKTFGWSSTPKYVTNEKKVNFCLFSSLLYFNLF